MAFDLLCKMVEYDPNKRITASQALDHPYFKEDPLPGIKYVFIYFFYLFIFLFIFIIYFYYLFLLFIFIIYFILIILF